MSKHGWNARLGVMLVLLGFMSIPARSRDAARAGREVRLPSVAGQFYPAEASRLRTALDAFFADAMPPRATGVRALVAPHAGIIYSGQIAADAYAQARTTSEAPDVVVILGTNHTAPGFEKVAVSPASAFRTPLGDCPVDIELAQALVDECADCTFDADVHAREHSVEVQVPFIQHAFPGARIVPLVVGSDDVRLAHRFGGCLARLVSRRHALVVASSDLSHYPAAAEADRVDRETLEAIATLDVARAKAVVSRDDGRVSGLSTRACGVAPVLAAMGTARAMGATSATILSYSSSGRMLVGDSTRVVGYGAVAMVSGEVHAGQSAFEPYDGQTETTPLTLSQKRALLALARTTLDRALSAEVVPLPRGYDARLWVPQGAFVTLKRRKDGGLRGCVGTIPPDFPLAQTVGRMALSAALTDARFPPVLHQELRDLTIEISALSPAREVSTPDAIVIGTHGVILQAHDRSAVFLPQVASEQGWDRDEMLDQLCRKAGLSLGCWRKRARLSVFDAQVFREALR